MKADNDQPTPERAFRRTPETVLEPPSSWKGILRHLGPGLIVAGSIVGSGELIATTKTGAEAGFWLLWLIFIGCVIKVFVQIEFGRFAVTQGKTTLEGLNLVPGPRSRVNWLVWYWLVMTLLAIAQQGGIVGGVSQAMAISVPLTEEGRLFNQVQDKTIKLQVAEALTERFETALTQTDLPTEQRDHYTERLTELELEKLALQNQLDELGPAPQAIDDKIWAVGIMLVTTVLLVLGRYQFIQIFSTVFVASFTLVTVVTVFALQFQPDWAIQGRELAQGMSFRLPPVVDEFLELNPVATALATFGIIGVGAAEIIFYPYWCLEKGYARYTGPKDSSPSWFERARGWMRVMRWDAWCSMVIYTFATVAFYLLGASILHRAGLNPAGNDMIRTLAEMYVPVFGSWAPGLFLLGAFAVLYSTLFIALASNARVAADAVRVFRLGAQSEQALTWWRKFFCVAFPLLAIVMLLWTAAPVKLVLASGIAQAIMLPMLAAAALYYRYRHCEKPLQPSRIWDLFLWLSGVAFLITGLWTIWSKLS